MNKTNIHRFLEYEFKKFDEKKRTERIIIIWLLNLFFYFVGINSIYVGICISIMNVIISIFWANSMHKSDNIEYKLLFNGVFYLYLSCLLVFLSYKVLSIGNLKILCYYYLGFIIFTGIGWCILFFIINSGKYKHKEIKNKSYPYAGALIGFLLTRFIFENLELSQGELQIFGSVFLFVVAIAISCNNFDLLKIILIKTLHLNV